MTPTEIKETLDREFPGSVIDNEELAESQIELKPDQWLYIATY